MVIREVAIFEIMRIPDKERKDKVLLLTDLAVENTRIDDNVKDRAEAIMTMGFSAYDAFHIACAEHSHASAFLTTDDRLLNKARKNRNEIRVKVCNPVVWLMEEIQNGENSDTE